MIRKKIFTPKQLVGGTGLVAAILAAVVSIEGGYVNHPKDPGGETNHGITVKVARQAGYTGTMRDLPKQVALDIYRKQYVEQPHFLPIIDAQPLVGYKLVDVAVNAGPSRSIRWFQQSLNILSRDGKDWSLIAVDGSIGQKTLAAYSSLEKKRGKAKACELIIKAVEACQARNYINLKMHDFTVGWLDRRIGNLDYSECLN